MNYKEMCDAIEDAERTIKRAEMFKNKMASFLVGRLCNIDYSKLCALKKELKHFNSKTGKWNK